MKTIIPWVCAVTMVQAPVIFASEGLDAYREGNYDKAAAAFSQQKNTDPIVAYYLGRMQLYGYGQLKDNISAFRSLKLAAEKGSLPAQNMLARYALLVDNNPEMAFVWFKKAAEANTLDANRYVAAAYEFGFGVKKNVDLAKRYYIAAARLGDPLSQYALAESFLETRQLANKKLGLLWLNKAILQNLPIAEIRLAQLYRTGSAGLPKDLAAAQKLVDLALSQGYLPAFYEQGELCLANNDMIGAKKAYLQAANAHDPNAEIALAELALQDKSPNADLHAGFLWILKAAQNGSQVAQKRLAAMYKDGLGVAKNEQLAKEWQQRANLTPRLTLEQARNKACLWLTNGKTANFAETEYQLTGILRPWNNPLALKEQQYHPAPQLAGITRASLYRPKFVMVEPNAVSIRDYYQALVRNSLVKSTPIQFLRYPIVEAVLENTNQNASRIEGLEAQAILGDSSAQVELGQRYQDGIGVAKNTENALKYYEMARVQQDLRADYLSSIILLEQDNSKSQKEGVNRLMETALKGNAYAQYALAQMNAEGFAEVPVNQAAATALFELAAVNGYGPAQYALAERMAREISTDLSEEGSLKRQAMIQSLYQGAVSQGISQAIVPLAYYHAMDADPKIRAAAFSAAKQQADLGNPDAALLVGLMYDRGFAVDRDNKEALAWYQKSGSNPISAFVRGTYLSQNNPSVEGEALLAQAAKQGFAYAELNLAILKHARKAEFLPLLESAQASGNSTAGLLLADYYLSQSSTPADLQKARTIYQKFADRGDKISALKLGYLYENGLGGTLNRQESEHWYRVAAEQGLPEAQYLLGRLYQLGWITPNPDYIAAKKWYAQAQSSYAPAAIAYGFIAETVDDQDASSAYLLASNNPIAQYNLGLIYEQGKNGVVDYAKARNYYQQAASQGHVQSMVQQALLDLNGLDRRVDEKSAVEGLRKAALLGNREALYQLAILAESGVGLPLNEITAVDFYQKAADKGHANARLALARMYQHGLGVDKSLEKAKELYKSLADAGNAYAQYQLAMLEYTAATHDVELKRVKTLLQQSAENGQSSAMLALQRLNKTTPIEITPVKTAPAVSTLSAQRIYYDAICAWNEGNEQKARALIAALMLKSPNDPNAKRAFSLLNQDSFVHTQGALVSR